MNSYITPIQQKLPDEYIEIIAKNIPSAIFTYITLWRLKDHKNRICVDKKRIPTTMLIEKPVFLRSITKLCREQLLNIHETKTHFYIELVGWDYELDS